MARTALCFGTFDGLDAAHRRFLEAARAHGDRLVVSVARDAHVRTFKGHIPRYGEQARLGAVLATGIVSEAHLSDETPGDFQIIRKISPTVVVLGHDQDALTEALAAWCTEQSVELPIERIPFFPEDQHG